MKYKHDWDQAQERFKAWWQCEIIDRVCLQVFTFDGPFEMQPDATKWLDVDYNITRAIERMEHTYYGGEAFPAYYANLGPDAFAAYHGSNMRFAKNTTWVDPLVLDWETDFDRIRFSQENELWKTTVKMTEEAVKRSNGDFVVGMTDIHDGIDALAAIRGSEQLCIDMTESGEFLFKALEVLSKSSETIYDTLYESSNAKEWGTTFWLPVWAPQKCAVLQRDFVSLISPSMFEEFVLPELSQQAKRFPYSVYHLDSENAARHLDLILEIPEINAVQWAPTNCGIFEEHWIPIIKKIQDKKKSVWVHVAPEYIDDMLDTFKPEGLMLYTGAYSKEEADSYLRKMEKSRCKKVGWK